MSEFRALVFGDVQVPYHDRDAIDVMVQIGREFKPHVVADDGDFADLFNLSSHPNAKTAITEQFVEDLDGEIDKSVALQKHIIAEVNPQLWLKNNGNHEFRVLRAIHRANGNEKKLLEMRVARNVYSSPSLFRLDELGIPYKFGGEYPKGQNVHPELPHHENVWLEHGLIAAQESGYTGNRTMKKRWGNVIVGHCERLAGPNWTHVNGDRNYFNIENGNMSILGVPGLGDDIYSGIYHSTPDYGNHTQGFTLLTHVSGEWFPQVIRIVKGTAFWGNKLYVSRVKKSKTPTPQALTL